MIFISPLPPSTGVFLLTENISMDKHSQKKKAKATTSQDEVSSLKWELIKISEQEEDVINRMYRLVPNRWDLIAGRIPGRTPEEIERFWIMSHGENFAQQRK